MERRDEVERERVVIKEEGDPAPAEHVGDPPHGKLPRA
jgi:hypothetical protein